MILSIIFSILGIIVYVYIGINIYQNLVDKKKFNEYAVVYFFIMYFILFIILVNIIIITVFHSKILNKTGPTGPIGFRGDRGDKGSSGECNSDCYKIELKVELINFIEDTYNDLLKTDKLYKGNNINIKNEIKDPETGKIVNLKLKNILLNDYVDNIIYSQQYQDAILSKKTVNEIDQYIKSILKQWITLIYKELPKNNKHSTDTKLNFFLNENSRSDNIEWINSNPFDKIEKYDLYQWGKTRVFKPIKIYLDKNPDNSNYLPQDGKPPLKILKTNHYKFLYENSKHDVKNDGIKNIINKYPKNLGSIWKNNNIVTYRKEKYFPVGDLIIGPDNNYETTDISYIKDTEYNEKYSFSTKQEDGNLDGVVGEKIEGSKCIETIKEVQWDKVGGNLREKTKKEKVIVCPRKGNLKFKPPSKETILVTGDVEDPEDYELLWNNKDSYERMNLTIWRPKCPEGYESLSDVATVDVDNEGKPIKPKKDSFKCVPKKCLTKNENELKTILKTYDNQEIVGLSNNKDNLKALNDNSYNFFRFKTKDKTKEQKPLYTINEQCKSSAYTESKPVEDRYKELGYGWHGRPVRNPKYSIFSYLVQMPEAIISSKETNYKYYIIHADLYDGDKNDKNFKTTAKNLYYILTLNYNNYKYDRCFSTFGNSDELIRTRIRSEDQSYWILEKVKGKKDEIRLKSKKTGKYFQHNRNKNLRRDLVKNRVFEKQVPLNKNDNSLIFVNIKSAFGTNIDTAIEDGKPRIEEKYYLNDDENIINLSYDKNHVYPKR